MPPVTIEYKEGIFIIVHSPSDKRTAFFRKDGQLQSAPPVMGLNYANGEFVPISCTPEGKLDTTATLTGSITIGDVSIQDKVNPAIDLSVLQPGGAAALALGGLMIMGKSLAATMLPLTLNPAGALSIDDSIMQKQNMTTDITYVGAGNPGEGQVATLAEYPTGSPGVKKLSTFTYNVDDKVSKIEVTTI